jgi:hypothetical protein
MTGRQSKLKATGGHLTGQNHGKRLGATTKAARPHEHILLVLVRDGDGIAAKKPVKVTTDFVVVLYPDRAGALGNTGE